MGGPLQKSTDPKGLDCGILYGLRIPPRNENRLAGLAAWCEPCARGTISDFATLVRKSYSDALSPVSNLVLEKRTLKRSDEFGNVWPS